MYLLQRTFELAICLFGYWLGRGLGGWGGGVLFAFAALCAWSLAWDWLAANLFLRGGEGSDRMNIAYGAVSIVSVAAATYVLWGK